MSKSCNPVSALLDRLAREDCRGLQKAPYTDPCGIVNQPDDSIYHSSRFNIVKQVKNGEVKWQQPDMSTFDRVENHNDIKRTMAADAVQNQQVEPPSLFRLTMKQLLQIEKRVADIEKEMKQLTIQANQPQPVTHSRKRNMKTMQARHRRDTKKASELQASLRVELKALLEALH